MLPSNNQLLISQSRFASNQLSPSSSSSRHDVWAKSYKRQKSHLNPNAPRREKSDIVSDQNSNSLSSVFNLSSNAHTRIAGGSKPDENGSIYSKSLKDRIREFGNPLRGPVVIEMFVHYFYFLIVLLFAFTSELDKEIRLYMSIFYMNLSIFTLEISRLIYAKRDNSIIPVYLSLPMFALLIIVSRSVHQIVMVLWYISFLLVCMQSGSRQLQKHFKIYTVAFMSVYIAVIFAMSVFYRKNCVEVFCGVELNPPIKINQELILLFACLMVVVSCMMLERFIRRNAIALLDRENYMRQLYFANVDLKRQLRQDTPKNEFDLEAPLSKATQILKMVKDSAGLDEGIQKELGLLMILLTSDHLYSPDIYQKTADSDVHGWLNDMLSPSNANGKKISSSEIVSGKRTSAMDSSGIRPEILIEFDFQAEATVTGAEQEYFKHLQTHSELPSYDILEIDNITCGRSLYYYAWYLFRKLNFFQKFKIKEEKFLHWISEIESGYIRENPYHNHIHAADVTHAMHYYITRKKIWVYLTPEEQIASIIAPIIHDYAHPGVNNSFLIAIMDPLAIKYSDQSVLEHFHTASVFEMMQKDEFNILENLSADERKPIREMVISMVLATDMTFHFDWIGKFKTKMAGAGLNLDQRADRKLLLNMAIKCADVNNPSKPPEQSRRWTDLVMEEFFRQGDREKARGLPVSMFMSRGQTDIPKCQLGFIDYIVNPLFESWQMYMGEDILGHLDNISLNKVFWKAQSDGSALPSALNPNSAARRQNSTQLHGSVAGDDPSRSRDLAGSAKSSRENMSRGSVRSFSRQEAGGGPMMRTGSREMLGGKRSTDRHPQQSPGHASEGSLFRRNRADSSAK